MSILKNHGRKTAIALGISLFFLVSLAFTWLFRSENSDSSHKTVQEEALINQTQLLTNDILRSIRELRSISPLARMNSNPHSGEKIVSRAPLPKGVLHWAEFEINLSNQKQLLDSHSDPSIRSVLREKTYLQNISNQIKMKMIFQQGFQSLRVRPRSKERREWMAIAFLKESTQSAQKRLVITLIEPQKFFSSIEALASSEKLSAYIVSRQGDVIAHSQQPYVGANFKDNAIITQTLASLFKNEITDGIRMTEGLNSLQVLAAYRKLAHLPMAVVIEQSAMSPTHPFLSKIREALYRISGLALPILGFFVLSFLLIYWLIKIKQLWNRPSESKPLFYAASPTTTSKQRAQHFSKQKIDRAPFEKLVSLTSKSCHAPALFFEYDTSLRRCKLSEWSSPLLDPKKSFSPSFSLSENALTQIQKSALADKVPSLDTYAPLLNLALHHLAPSYPIDDPLEPIEFAWAVTHHKKRKETLRKRKPEEIELFGILVVLRSPQARRPEMTESQKATQRDTLVRMMKKAANDHANQRLPFFQPRPDIAASSASSSGKAQL